MARGYVPDSGDIVWFNFTLHAGHEQVKSVDWRARKAVRKGKAAPAELAEVRAKIRALIG